MTDASEFQSALVVASSYAQCVMHHRGADADIAHWLCPEEMRAYEEACKLLELAFSLARSSREPAIEPHHARQPAPPM